jgi:hypothetical protein
MFFSLRWISPHSLQLLGRIQVLEKPVISAIVPSRMTTNYLQTISIVGYNFDSSLTVSCLAIESVTVASILNSKWPVRNQLH